MKNRIFTLIALLIVMVLIILNMLKITIPQVWLISATVLVAGLVIDKFRTKGNNNQ